MSKYVTSDTGPCAFVPLWVIKSTVGNLAKVLYMRLSIYANYDTANCYPSQKTLASELGCGDRAVREALTELVSIGALAITPRFEHGRQTTNLYHILRVDPSSIDPPPVVNGSGGVELQTHPGVEPQFLQNENQYEREPIKGAPAAQVSHKPEKRPRRESSGDHATLVRYITATWQENHGSKYHFQPKDGVAAATLLIACEGNITTAKGVWRRYLDCNDKFFQGHPVTMLTSASQLPRFMATKQPENDDSPWPVIYPTQEEYDRVFGGSNK